MKIDELTKVHLKERLNKIMNDNVYPTIELQADIIFILSILTVLLEVEE